MNPMKIPTIRVVVMVIPSRALWDMPSWGVANGLVSNIVVPSIGSEMGESVGTMTGAAVGGLGATGASVLGSSAR